VLEAIELAQSHGYGGYRETGCRPRMKWLPHLSTCYGRFWSRSNFESVVRSWRLRLRHKRRNCVNGSAKSFYNWRRRLGELLEQGGVSLAAATHLHLP